MRRLGHDKQVVIQKRIDEVMKEEFDKMIKESSKDPLLRLLLEGRIASMSIKEIRDHLKGKEHE